MILVSYQIWKKYIKGMNADYMKEFNTLCLSLIGRVVICSTILVVYLHNSTPGMWVWGTSKMAKEYSDYLEIEMMDRYQKSQDPIIVLYLKQALSEQSAKMVVISRQVLWSLFHSPIE